MMLSHTSPVLEVSLRALRQNYLLLKSRFSGSECAGVVKANAYGLGMPEVAEELVRAGCRTFFVATLDEGLALRTLLPSVRVAVFHGPYEGEEQEYVENQLIPVLNTLGQVARWVQAAANNADAEAILHVDTGMNRVGLNHKEALALAERPEALLAANIHTIMTHMACAGEAAHPKNAEQLARFNEVRSALPARLQGSMANSSTIFLPQEYHADLARPGCALYGINPIDTGAENPMQPVVTLRAPVLQVRTIEREDTVGYGATKEVRPGQKIATVQLGYADGYFRSMGNIGNAYVGDHKVTIAGRVSMDMIMIDVTDVPEDALAGGVEFMNERLTVDMLAEATGTIGYEVLTRLGRRVRRVYTGLA